MNSATPSPSIDPFRRSLIWWSFQLLLQWSFTLFVKYRVRGTNRLPTDAGALLLANHQCNADPLMVGMALNRPVSFMARSTLFRIPVLGWLLQNTYVVPIDREAARAGAIRELASRMERGFLVGMFPEGTRTNDGQLGEFKPGFVALVRRARVPIVPVGIAGGFEFFPRGRWPRPGRVRVVFGEPWQPEDYAEFCERGREADLVAAVKQRVQDCVDEATLWRSNRSQAGVQAPRRERQ
ncbi:MAG: lysophospholipid acyltransferase family protein [Planctomycetaceae bacterium]|nr:lysophospholipid acyltransferase family protein [Planctomycetaceae bacterium]